MEQVNLSAQHKPDWALFLPAVSSFYISGLGKQRKGEEYFDQARIPAQFNGDVEKLNFLNNFNALAWEGWDNFTIATNFARIESSVDLRGNPNVQDSIRPLQGQSPYLINSSLGYYNAESAFGATILYNVIGRRIREAGFLGYENVWEAPRNLIDLQISKTFLDKFELKATISDVLNQSRDYYQDMDKNKVYNADKDLLIERTNFGTTYSFALSYKF
jgi:hypothetical protein